MIDMVHHNFYDVTFHTHNIHTLLTNDHNKVDSWLSDIRRLYRNRIIVGLDIEWRPNTQRNMQNRVATLQLCVGNRCLIFQIRHALFIPNSLGSFLADSNHKFVGVGIQGDVEKLINDHSLRVANFVDLRTVAADVLGDPDMRRAGLKTLALRVLGREVEKPESVTRSNWDKFYLTDEQVRYACIDAYVSFKIGLSLSSDGFSFP